MKTLLHQNSRCRYRSLVGFALSAACFVMFGISCEANAVEVIANFDGGTAAVPDAFAGTAGNGWEAPWSSFSASAANTVANTVPSSGGPVPGGGNYLGTTVTSGNSGAATYSLSRKFSSGIEQANPYRVEFTYRIDEDVTSGNSTFTGFEDRYMIAEGQGGMSTLNHTTASSGNNNYSWSIWGFGGDTDLQQAAGPNIAANVVRTWSFYNGNSADDFFDADSPAMISSGIPITTGGVYDFTIDVDPATNTWDATVDDGTNSFTQTGMGFRGDDGVKSTLHFFTKRSRLDSTTDQDVRAFSIDEVKITQETAATLLVNRITGDITLQNTGASPLNILGYSITSELGALNANAANFKSITNNYDEGNPGPNQIDVDDDWIILSEQQNGNNDLSEFQFSNSPGDGATIAAGQSVVLSQGDGAWIPSTNELDLTAEVTLNDGNGTLLTMPIIYEGNGEVPLLRGDLNHDGSLSSADWDIFAANNLADLSGFSVAQSYLLGDLDGDGENNTNDFLIFRADYNAEHGAGAFAAMSAQVVPEPTGLVLITCACVGGMLLLSSRGKQRENNMILVACQPTAKKQLGKRFVCLLVFLSLVARGNLAEAQVVANFDGGTSAVPDAFTGTVGDGWASDWNSFSASAANTVVNTVPSSGGPIAGGGNYLATEVTSGNSGAATYSLNRNFTNGVDQTNPYHIEFTYRIDEDVTSGSSTFTGFEDRYMIAEGPGGMTTLNHGTASNANNNYSWSIWGFGGDTVLPGGTTSETSVVRTWAFYDGSGAGTAFDANSAAMINTGIPMTTGGVYQFSIDVDPAANTWDATIDDGTNLFTQTGLGSRNNSGIGSRLNFFTKRSRLDSVTDEDVRAFSIDGISIENVAEQFVASINTTTGNITLRNDTSGAIDFSNYVIESPMGAFDITSWNSLSDQSGINPLVNPVDGDDVGGTAGDSSEESWVESGGSDAAVLGELFLIGSTVLNAGESISLGNAYNTAITDENIAFQFLDAGSESLKPGVVEFVTGSAEDADFNSDGDVDGSDFLAWQAGFGSGSSQAEGDANGDGKVNATDLSIWQTQYGNGIGTLAASAAVPEPSSVILLALAALVTTVARKK